MLRKKIVRWTIFADVATSDSEAIGTLRRKIPITCSKKEVTFVYQKLLLFLSKPQAWYIITARSAVHIIKGALRPCISSRVSVYPPAT